MKTTTLHRHLHPIHWHASMYVAIVAILLTAMKSSDELVKSLQAAPVRATTFSNIYLRDAETVHLPLNFGGLRHNATLSGS